MLKIYSYTRKTRNGVPQWLAQTTVDQQFFMDAYKLLWTRKISPFSTLTATLFFQQWDRMATSPPIYQPPPMEQAMLSKPYGITVRLLPLSFIFVAMPPPPLIYRIEKIPSHFFTY
jgi:hypothetical protein